MYDDAWYNAFVPRSSSPAPPPSQASATTSIRQQSQQQQQRRSKRESLLEMPNGDTLADDSTDAKLRRDNAVKEDGKGGKRLVTKGPPMATVARRAKSVSDFYDAVKEYPNVDEDDNWRYGQLDQDVLQQRTRVTRKNREKTPMKGVRTEIEFYDWYNNIEDELINASNEEFIEYREYLGLANRHFDSLIQNTDASLEILASITGSFQTVKDQTNASRLQCEDLMEEKRRFLLLEKDLAENLQYYSYLEPITKQLNAPGAGHFVRSREFSDMLINLDSCINYMESHPHHRESAVYRAKYKVLLTKALSLIRVHFTTSLREAAADISNRIADKQLNETTMSALLYAKFRTGALELKKVGMEIQKRAVLRTAKEAGRETEYQSLMNELTQSYANIRGKLILPLVTKRIGEIAIAPSTAKDLVAFARSSISYIRGVCADEFDLWYAWFATNSGLYDFLESTCEKLFDHIKPRIVHETQLSKLCELCSLIQARYMDDADDETSSETEDEEDKYEQGRVSLSSSSSISLDFLSLIQPVMEDAQTRLIFVAMSVMRNEIELYKPGPEDLQYPSKGRQRSVSGDDDGRSGKAPVLSGRKKPVKGPNVDSSGQGSNGVKEIGTQDWGFDASGSAREHWYPTLAKAVWLLSRIYRLINSNVFDDLAHQIVHQTTVSLHKAASLISSRVSPTDAKLFLIKHLLILKEHILAFDIEYTTSNTSHDMPPHSSSLDFANTTNNFWDLFQRDRSSNVSGSLLNPVNLVQFLSSGFFLPNSISNMVDAKSELDGRLRTVINEYVQEYVGRMTFEIGRVAPIDTTDTAIQQQHNNSNSNAQKERNEKPIHKTTPISNDTATKALHSTRTAILHNIPNLKRKLEEYIDNERTRAMLLGAVLEGVLGKYGNFWERVESRSHDHTNNTNKSKDINSDGDNESRKKNKNKYNMVDDENDSDMLWSPEVFARWCTNIFGVGRVIGGNNTAAAASTTTSAATGTGTGTIAVLGKERKDGNQNASQASKQSSIKMNDSSSEEDDNEVESESGSESENDE